MIDPALFNMDRLVQTLLDNDAGCRICWRNDCEIIPAYMPRFPDKATRPRVVVRYIPRDSFLRHSAGPRQGHFWDCYGDDYLTPELALLALMEAPKP